MCQAAGVAMRAVVVDPESPEGFRLAQVDEPVPGPSQVLIDAHHVSLNRGDLNDAPTHGSARPNDAPTHGSAGPTDAHSGRLPPGAVLGSDVSGVVVRSAADGQGPPVGARVVAFTSGAFAQRVVADVDSLAEVPAGVELAVAAALPVAGVAAVQALRAGLLETPLKGARVLVTGASGGVGRFAVQLAAYGGAHVIAVVADPARAAELTALGAEETVTEVEQVFEPVELVIDNVGGAQLVSAWSRLAPGGNVQCVGASSGQPSTFAPYATVGPAKSLSSFLITPPVGPDLTSLVRLVAEGSLRVPLAWRGPLARIADAADALRGRRVPGKAVLDVRARSRPS